MDHSEFQSDVFGLAPSELLERVANMDAEAERRSIQDQSVALAAIVSQIALKKKGLVEYDLPEDEMLGAATHLLEELGLDAVIAISGEDPLEKAQEQAEWIKARRGELGLSQTEFGARYGFSRWAILRAEQGRLSALKVSSVISAADQDQGQE